MPLAFRMRRAQLVTIVHPFTYHRPDSVRAALDALAAQGAYAVGGGTDLLVTMKEQLVRPLHLVDLRRLPAARDIVLRSDGSVRVGGAVRIADLAAHSVIRANFAALAEAAKLVGTPALRNMGTIAGNLCQRPRCWYFRKCIPCLKNHATGCPAMDGENEYHGIFDEGPCRAVHPSDPAVALTALEATVELVGAGDARRSVPMADFYLGAAANARAETTIAADELIEAIELPAHSSGGTQRYRKLMQRGAWDFALVALAAVRRSDGEVRLVLGGVAARPYRVNQSVEEDVASGELDDESVDALAERALYDAMPLAKNGYKVKQAAVLLRDAMRELSRA
ncbi:MAG TPA: FAD binding domain-containing protein [Gemmatimonadaceae bacterium]|nr:FAD binding domain-containing protein [Gemmatimonadaceae bacterium]